VNIPLGARIIAVADTFDAITSTRSYRPASNHKFALSVLRKEAGRQLDPDAVHAFLAYYTGRRSLLRWVILFTGPHRILGQAMGWFQGAAASTAANAATVGTAAFVSGSVLVGGATLAPAVASHFKEGGTRSASTIARVGHGDRSGLPGGLAKRETLPPGLAKKDKLPPGLAKKVGSGGPAKQGGSKGRKEHAGAKKIKKERTARPVNPVPRSNARQGGKSATARAAHQPAKAEKSHGGPGTARKPTKAEKVDDETDGAGSPNKEASAAGDGKPGEDKAQTPNSMTDTRDLSTGA
jgi:hypothetical protein